VKNPRAVAERNAHSGKILDVRENTHKVPQCKKGPSGKVPFFPEKGGYFPWKMAGNAGKMAGNWQD
jgi:hypothetical protein